MGYTILITGASGYLGSVLCVDLARDHNIVALDRLTPSEKLRRAAPSVLWEKGDVADADCIDWVFRRSLLRGNKIDYVIHFAAYTDFSKKWQDEYSNTNVIGTRNIIEASFEAGVKRILFAGSIAALEPVPMNMKNVLTEKSIACGEVAYAKSKAIGETLLFKNSDRLPVVVLRLGGVFTDWCELPPLFSIMKMWSKPFIGRMMPGEGLSGFPYLHRRDVVRIVRRIIEKNNSLDRFEILFASENGCTCQKDLFPAIRKECNINFSIKPLNVPLPIARAVLHGKYAFNTMLKRKTYEQAWMIDYVDRPLVVDTNYTRKKLDWEPTPGLNILELIQVIMKNFNRHQRRWYIRNINRNDQKYQYYPD
ncbi:MAG: NAD(P)-dependent oxidoreductase [Desulfamplus sp.]|nr:NAD(P)-dependent oxidoreductase [Desulfamplus sp.]